MADSSIKPLAEDYLVSELMDYIYDVISLPRGYVHYIATTLNRLGWDFESAEYYREYLEAAYWRWFTRGE